MMTGSRLQSGNSVHIKMRERKSNSADCGLNVNPLIIVRLWRWSIPPVDDQSAGPWVSGAKRFSQAGLMAPREEVSTIYADRWDSIHSVTECVTRLNQGHIQLGNAGTEMTSTVFKHFLAFREWPLTVVLTGAIGDALFSSGGHPSFDFDIEDLSLFHKKKLPTTWVARQGEPKPYMGSPTSNNAGARKLS